MKPQTSITSTHGCYSLTHWFQIGARRWLILSVQDKNMVSEHLWTNGRSCTMKKELLNVTHPRKTKRKQDVLFCAHLVLVKSRLKHHVNRNWTGSVFTWSCVSNDFTSGLETSCRCDDACYHSESEIHPQSRVSTFISQNFNASFTVAQIHKLSLLKIRI